MSVYTVAQVNSYISRMFSEDFLLRKLTVRGEVSGCKYHQLGHIYFTLKDESGVLSCVVFRREAENLKIQIQDGRQYLVTGQIRVYEKTGHYQLYATAVKPDGQGELYERLAALRARLQETGMFDPAYKQPIPKYVQTLGVVTAPTGAAIRDIIHVSRRRYPGIQIVLYPAVVQGEEAAPSIVRGIEALAARGVDCMIVGRGGGSIEDLWAFNEEIVAQAIFDCPVPVISAVGHETDVTISDMVADKRAPTPSAAAEMAVFDAARLEEDLAGLEMGLADRMETLLARARERLESRRRALALGSPGSRIAVRRQRAGHLRELLRRQMETRLQRARGAQSGRERLEAAMQRRLFEARKRAELYREKLTGLSPGKRIRAGYAFITDGDGRPVSSVAEVRPGEVLRLTLADGRVAARAETVEADAAWAERGGDG